MAETISSISVRLDADTAQYIKALKQAQDDTNKRLKSMESDFNQFQSSLGVIGGALATAFSAATIIDFVDQMNQAHREITRSAEAAELSVDEFQSMSVAVSTVGINTEQLGSILGDTEEKIGDFIATGGGGFNDFVQVMGLTEDQAKETAKELQGLSGDEVLVEMVRQLDEAGTSSEEMNFALEGMASDARYLIPLLRDNASGLRELQEEAQRLDISIPEENIEAMGRLGFSVESIKNNFTDLGIYLTSELQPIFDDLDDWISELITDFIEWNERTNDFADAFQYLTGVVQSVVALFKLLGIAWDDTVDLIETNAEGLMNFFDYWFDNLGLYFDSFGEGFVDAWDTAIAQAKVLLGEFLVLVGQELENVPLLGDVGSSIVGSGQSIITEAQTVINTIANTQSEVDEQIQENRKRYLLEQEALEVQFQQRRAQRNIEGIEATASAYKNITEGFVGLYLDEEISKTNVELDSTEQTKEVTKTEIEKDTSTKDIDSVINTTEKTFGEIYSQIDLVDTLNYEAAETYRETEALKTQYLVDAESIRNQLYIDSATTYEERLDRELELELAQLDERLVGTEEYEAKKAAIEDQYRQRKQELEEQSAMVQQQMWLQSISTLGNAFGMLGEESEGFAKAAFLANQTVAFVNAIINTEEAATKALTVDPYGVLSAVVRTTGYASAGVIAGQTIAGIAHGGLEDVPEEGTYLLEQGERVIQPDQNVDLDNFLQAQESMNYQSGDTVINANMTIQGNVTDEPWFAAQIMKQRDVINAAYKKSNQENPSRRRKA